MLVKRQTPVGTPGADGTLTNSFKPSLGPNIRPFFPRRRVKNAASYSQHSRITSAPVTNKKFFTCLFSFRSQNEPFVVKDHETPGAF